MNLDNEYAAYISLGDITTEQANKLLKYDSDSADEEFYTLIPEVMHHVYKEIIYALGQVNVPWNKVQHLKGFQVLVTVKTFGVYEYEGCTMNFVVIPLFS